MTVSGLVMSTISIVVGLSMAAIMVTFSTTEVGELMKVEGRWSAKHMSKEEGQSTSCQDFIKWRKNSYNHGISYSTKTGYLFEEDVKDDESKINGCTISEVYAIYRHGTRTPVNKHISKYGHLQDTLKMFISRSSMLTPFVKQIKGWTNPFDKPTSEHLAVSGMKEHYCLAKRMKERFHRLFVHRYSPNWYSIHGTFKERTMQSASSFAHGLFEEQGPLNGYQPVVTTINDKLLRFFDQCHYYGDLRGNNQTVKDYINSFLDQPIVTEVRRNIQRKIDPKGELWNVTAKQIDDMYSICALETAIYGNSMWCSLFSKEEKSIFEYRADLKHYVKRSYDHRVNWRITCSMYDDILKHMANTISSIPDTPRVILRFAHAETMIPLITALGLYKDKEPLLPTNYEAQKDRLFTTGKFCPFAGNLVFALYSCENDRDVPVYKVRILLNEKPIMLNHLHCDKEYPFFCSYDEFKNILHEISSGEVVSCNLDDICSKDT